MELVDKNSKQMKRRKGMITYEVYSFKKMVRIWLKKLEIEELYGGSVWDAPKKVKKRHEELNSETNHIYRNCCRYYKLKFFDTLRAYIWKLEALPIESKRKDDIINRFRKILAFRVYIDFAREDNDKEIKNTPYIRNSIKKLMKFLKENDLYTEEDGKFAEWIEDYFEFIIIYYDGIDKDVATAYYMIKKH